MIDFKEEHVLFFWAYVGDLIQVRKAIEEDPALVNLRTTHDHSLCKLAILGGQLELIQWLIGQGHANTTEKDMDGVTFLLIAVEFGHINVVQWLLEAGISSLDEINNLGNSAFMQAAINGHWNIMALLLQRGEVFPYRINHQGNSAFHYAAYFGHKTIVEGLLKRADPFFDRKNHRGYSPFLYAVLSGHNDIVALLVHKKRDSLYEINNEGNNAYHLAAAAGNDSTLEYLFSMAGQSIYQLNHCGESPLAMAVRFGHLHIVEWFFQRGLGSLQERRHASESLLFIAAVENQVHIMEWLLLNGASLYEKDIEGKTVLMGAAAYGKLEALTWLVGKGININVQNTFHFTALSLAILNVETEVVEYLIKQPSLSYLTLLLAYQLVITDEYKNNTIKSLITTFLEHTDHIIAEAGIEIPDLYCCFLTGHLMIEPVTGPDGRTYEKAAILNWLSQKESSPHTRMSMKPDQLHPNLFAKELIDKKCQEIDALLMRQRLSVYATAPFVSSLGLFAGSDRAYRACDVGASTYDLGV